MNAQQNDVSQEIFNEPTSLDGTSFRRHIHTNIFSVFMTSFQNSVKRLKMLLEIFLQPCFSGGEKNNRQKKKKKKQKKDSIKEKK